MELNEITGRIVGSALRIHKAIGPGLLESVYETVLARDLRRLGLFVEQQKWISFDFEGLWFEDVLRLDLLVERRPVVEVKSVTAISAAHEKQLLTYVKLVDAQAGLLLNFGGALLRKGIRRVVHRL